jgi:sterol 3beta-glucosyltransferase
MKITMIAIGTRGDVQPAVAVGKALSSKGHIIRILAGANFQNWIKSHGLEAVASQTDIQAVMESPLGREWIEKKNPIAQMRVIKKLTDQSGWQSMREAWNACSDADAIFSSFTSDVYALSISEKLRVPLISMPLQPTLYPTRSGAATMNAPRPNHNSILNYFFGRYFLEPFGWRISGEMVNRFRREILGLMSQTRSQYLRAKRRLFTVQAYSRHVVPHAEDWPSTIRTTGFCFLEEQREWKPPVELVRFIESGEPPVCIGFGSMVGGNLEYITQTVIKAVKESGRRAVLLSGWAGIGNEEKDNQIYRLEAAPHEWLYPRMSAVVHHGGAGSTASSLRAGVPTVIVPHLGDQSFWGQRVHALGAGPKPIPRTRLTSAKLAKAIVTAAGDADMKRRAEDLAGRIRSEDGTAQAVNAIEEYFNVRL